MYRAPDSSTQCMLNMNLLSFIDRHITHLIVPDLATIKSITLACKGTQSIKLHTHTHSSFHFPSTIITASIILLSLQLILLNRKSHLHKIMFLLFMHTLQSCRHARTRTSPRIHNMSSIVMFRLIKQRLNPWLRKGPGTSIQRFLLTPNQILGIRI